MIKGMMKQLSVEVPMATMVRPHMVADGRARCDFDSLDGVHGQQAKPSIKIIEAGELPKLAAVAKTMVDVFRLLEGPHIWAKSEETHRLQKSRGALLVWNVQTAPFEQFQLGRNVYGGFAEYPHAKKVPGIKNPHNLCLATDATRGMAGVLPQRLGSCLTLCKTFVLP